MRFNFQAIFAATALLCAAGAHAQSNEALKAAAQKAVNANPDVTARFNAYRAAADAVSAARGGYYPRVDLSASVGRDHDTINSRTPENQSVSRSGAALSLTQLLWDGLATQKEVGRLGHEKLARYFEVLDITEQTALEAARAYYDVIRYRRLVQLAEDSYVAHRSAFNQIQSRFRAGVGRGVDLEQAGARLALAESNLSTEVANLHDVSARYQRVVGEAPPKNLPMPTLFKQGIPASATDASNEAVRNNAAISASIESLRSARELVSARESAYQPKVEARVRSGAGNNFDGVVDQRRDASAEIVLNWNLFNGGTDRARVRQQVNLLNQAADLRDKACRDARQVVAIAYNDTRKLNDQLLYLDRNTLAIEKARDAYRQQFDIGQRSLLDLLNSENELYTARRSYANAEYDLGIAYVRTHAAVNQLGVQLGLVRDNEAPQAPGEMTGWAAGEDGPTRCPAVAIEMESIDLQALDRRASTPTTPGTAPAVPAPASAPAPTSATPRAR
jgi:adhesin transport system outer membrane protein